MSRENLFYDKTCHYKTESSHSQGVIKISVVFSVTVLIYFIQTINGLMSTPIQFKKTHHCLYNKWKLSSWRVTPNNTCYNRSGLTQLYDVWPKLPNLTWKHSVMFFLSQNNTNSWPDVCRCQYQQTACMSMFFSLPWNSTSHSLFQYPPVRHIFKEERKS